MFGWIRARFYAKNACFSFFNRLRIAATDSADRGLLSALAAMYVT